MTVAIDGFQLMRAIGSNREAFADARAAVSKSALAIVVGQLKAKGLSLSKLQELSSALGAATFALVLEAMDDKSVTGLLTKIDKHNPEKATASATWKRGHVCALAGRRAEPSLPPAPKPKAAAKSKASGGRKQPAASPTGSSFFPKSMEVKPRRKLKDPEQ